MTGKILLMSLLMICLIMPGVTSYDTLFSWAEGNTTLNISFTGLNNYTGNLSIPSGAWSINISFNMTGFGIFFDTDSDSFESGSIGNNWEQYDGDDTNWANISINSSSGQGFGSHHAVISTYFTVPTSTVNFTLDNTSSFDSLNLSFYFGMDESFDTGNHWTLGTADPNPQEGIDMYWTTGGGNTSLFAYDGSSVSSSICQWNASSGIQKLTIEANYTNQTARFYCNDELHLTFSARIIGLLTPFTELRLSSENQNANSVLYIDNLTIENAVPTPYPYNLTLVYNDENKYNDPTYLINTTPVVMHINKTYSDNLFDIVFKSDDAGYLYVYDLFAEWNSPNLSIRVNTEERDLLYEASNITVNRIYDNVTWDSYWTTNGLINVVLLNVSGIIDLYYYDNAGFFPARHFYYYNDPSVSKNITIYVVNETNVTEVLFTLYRENGNTLPNYYIGVDKYLPEYNDYVTVEMHRMDYNGQAVLNVEYIGAEYRFIVYDSNLNLIYTGDKTQIKSTSLTLTVSLVEDIWNTLQNVRGVTVGAIQYNNVTHQFVTYYNDSEGLLDHVTFKTIQRTAFGDTTICENVSESSSATLYCTIDPNGTGVFLSSLVVESASNYSDALVSVGEYSNRDQQNKIGLTGVFAWMLIFIVIVFLGLYNPAVAVLFAMLGLIAGVVMHISVISYTMLAVIIILGGIIIFKLKT